MKKKENNNTNFFKLIKKIIRFFQIDLQYLCIEKISLPIRIKNVIFTNIAILINIIINSKKFYKVKINGKKINYDSKYATKSFLVAAYDFYNETRRSSIFLKEPIIIDVGANIGQYLFAIKALVPDAKVYSIEADPLIYKILKENASQLTNVKVYKKILSDKIGCINFYICKKFSTWSTLIKPENITFYRKTKVNVVDGDRLFSRLKSIDLLKIDVEGAEWQVLNGFKKTLRKTNYILIELSISRDKTDQGSSKIIKYLLNHGFHIAHIGRIFVNGVGMEQSAANILFKKNEN